MAANIDSMMYVGEKPWHGLGTKLAGVATAAEAIAAAKLDWTVRKEPLYLKSGKLVECRWATVREDNNAVLGTVGSRYEVLQNKSAFSFFDAVVGCKEAIYHTAGSLGVGERIWILAKLPGQVRVIGDDVTDKFLLLTNTHNGTSVVQIMFTPIRVVCQNTLNIALSDSCREQRLRHTRDIGMRVQDVQTGLGIVNEKFRLFEEAAKALTRVQVDVPTWAKYLQDLDIMPTLKDSQTRLSSRAVAIIEEVSGLFEHGRGTNLPGVKGTAWAAFNAITEYVDHTRGGRGDNPEMSRATSLLFGSGADLKQKAWDAALALVK